QVILPSCPPAVEMAAVCCCPVSYGVACTGAYCVYRNDSTKFSDWITHQRQHKKELRDVLKQRFTKEKWSSSVAQYKDPCCNPKMSCLRAYYDSRTASKSCESCCFPLNCCLLF